MIYKSYFFSIGLRIFVLSAFLFLLCYGILEVNLYASISGSLLAIITAFNLYQFITRRFLAVDDFFEAVKYRDFSRFFVEERGPMDLRKLNGGFNLVNRTIRDMNSERQMQFMYLQKILEMVDVGIIAYNVNTGDVLWANESFLNTLDFPSFKNIKFLEKRRPQVYAELFENYHSNANTVNLEMNNERLKVLLSDTVFTLEEGSYKLIVLQNIERTLDENEAEAWKKLLSVMTHEIMNSIAPISSLAETLQKQLESSLDNPLADPLNLEDMYDGILSIKKRSEGLMKFARTYRSLNKVTQINVSNVTAVELFKSLGDLMQPSLSKKNIKLLFSVENEQMELQIDSYLIEQVLINLILNAIEACTSVEKGEVMVSAKRNMRGENIIQVADNGHGIPEDILDSIFIPFFSTKKTGSGVGLSLSKQIMTLHQGKIQVSSVLGKGSLITLTF
ncbi:sensor histidine kinase [Flavimarina sp. Hel_I_48]|uniref:sensor histidine kinase n=1 Tax=Flavimarina sp. Hel_I_48 TaxID=1392488 RepID=UPI0004DF71B9|nr:HAMP domain-containing sensor histidine kinase [Flavimarina sp. Hel_I_48]